MIWVLIYLLGYLVTFKLTWNEVIEEDKEIRADTAIMLVILSIWRPIVIIAYACYPIGKRLKRYKFKKKF